MTQQFNTKLKGKLVLTDSYHADKTLQKEKSLYKFIWVRSGSITLEIDHQEIMLAKNEIISLSNLQHLEFKSIDGDYLTLLFNSNFYCIYGNDHEVSCSGFLFNGSSHVIRFTLNEAEQKTLNDIADTLKHSAGAEAAVEPPAYRWAKELIWKPDDSRQELSSARMTKQVEQELSKRRFFSDLTEEFWFEYTRHPDAVALSAGAARRTGLPRVIVGPLSCTQLCSVMSADTIQAMRDRLLCAASDETYLEFETELTLDGHPSLCQIAVQITWASDEPGRFSSLFGRVLDIGERCRRLEDYRQAFAAPVLHPALLPVTVGADHVLRITGEQVIGVLESCRSMFDTVRLVDPEICMQLTDTADGAVMEKSEHCYDIWNKTQRCEHCISQEVIRTRRAQTKVEAVGDKVFYVHAACVEVDGTPYALELVSPIRMEDLRGDEDASVLNQLLLRNRQVYIDSTTHVYNRRYFDDRLRDLDGEFTLAMLDLDHFKHINDTYGHLAGDAAVSRAAQAIRSAIRTSDELVRYGGDEFFLLFHDMPRNALKKKLESIRAAVENLEFPEYPGLRITVSIGGAHAVGPLVDTVQKADQALYHAKAAKNRTVLYKEDLQ